MLEASERARRREGWMEREGGEVVGEREGREGGREEGTEKVYACVCVRW